MARSGSPYSTPRDANRVPLLVAASTADGITPVVLEADPVTHLLQVSSSGGGGGTQYAEGATTAPGTGTLSLGRYKSTPPSLTDGQVNALQLDTAGNLKVTGSLSVGGTTDNSAYTAGTSTGTPAMGFYHSTIDAVTDGRAATVAITANRANHTNLRNASGTEIGTSSTPVQVSLANTAANATAVKVDGSAVTQPVSLATNTPTLQSGSTTAVTQATAASLNATVVGTGTFAMQATLAAETTKVIGTVNVAAAQTIAVTNAGTFGAQATLQTQTDTVMIGGVNVKEINAVTPLMGNGTTGTGSQRVTVASDNTPFPVKTDQTSHGTTDLVAADITKVAGTSIVNGGVAGSQSVGGTVATNVAITANPLNLGVQAVSSENSAVTTARQVQLVADLVGKLIVLPYANPENFVSGTATATDTTSTSLVGAPASGLRNYITQFTVWNASAVNTYIKIQDGSGGTTLYTLPCPTVGGSVITLPTPLRQPTTATALFFAANASANAVFISASGYKGV